MRNTLTTLSHQLVTAVLAVCLSVCCCQAGMVVHGLSGDVVAAADDDACAGGCCRPVDEKSPDAPDDQAPAQGCKSCCVKGTGLKDTITIPATQLAVTAPLIAAPMLAALHPVALERPFEVAPFVDPPTLVRLRCALVV